jgi:hypothetical protein
VALFSGVASFPCGKGHGCWVENGGPPTDSSPFHLELRTPSPWTWCLFLRPLPKTLGWVGQSQAPRGTPGGTPSVGHFSARYPGKVGLAAQAWPQRTSLLLPPLPFHLLPLHSIHVSLLEHLLCPQSFPSCQKRPGTVCTHPHVGVRDEGEPAQTKPTWQYCHPQEPGQGSGRPSPQLIRRGRLEGC